MTRAGIYTARRHGGEPPAAIVRTAISGNICRCTGYHNIVKAIIEGARAMEAAAGTQHAAG